MELGELLAMPTAVCCMEMQRGVVGDLSTVEVTARAVQESGVVGRIAEVMTRARAEGAAVIHCTASFRADGEGSYANMPMIESFRARGEHLLTGTPSVQVIPDLFEPSYDLVSERHHGISPFAGTSLDTLLRARSTRTILATGVSLNRGVLGMVIEGVNRGYHAVVVRDGAVGYPAGYGDAVIEHSLEGIATVATAGEVVAAWGAA